jgi:TolB-like protein/tetratricopeptide (TPR) repeat protein
VGDGAVVRFLKELRRRRVFRVAGLYVVGIWLLMQVADILFPGWGIPDAAIRYLFWAGLLGFPVALVFGWVFDISAQGIRRTEPVASEDELLRSLPLRQADYLILGAILVAVSAIVYETTGRVLETAALDEAWRPSLAEIEPHSVAVLPFASLSADPEQAFFADGISEEILNRLAGFRELKVIARTSSFAFKDSGYDIGRISGLLAVNYLLQGSVRRDGERLRIAAQLVDRQGVQVWSSSFDRELGGIFVLQDEIAEAVATRIVPQIVPPAAVWHHEPDLEAYQEYLIGRENVTRRTAVFMQGDTQHFDRAIELDPEFAEPYAARAVSRIFNAIWADDYDRELGRARQDIERALELNPGLAMAHAAAGLLEQRRRPLDLAASEQFLRRALELDPNLVDALNWLSYVRNQQGRHREAEELLRRAAQIDPLAPVINANLALRDAQRGRFEAAERRLLRLMDLPQFSLPVYNALLDLYAQTGRIADELAIAKRMMLATVQQSGRLDYCFAPANAYARLGLVEQAADWYERWGKAWLEAPVLRLWGWVALGNQFGHLPPGLALAEYQAVLDDAGLQPEALGDSNLAGFGTLLLLAGEFERAIDILEPLLAANQAENFDHARHALAWARLERGESTAALALLEPIRDLCGTLETEGLLQLGHDLVHCALNALLAGRRELALERLTRAVDAGWRGYYELRNQPWWQGLRDEPEFQALMERLRIEVEAQRALVEAADATDEFQAKLEVALRLAQEGG